MRLPTPLLALVAGACTAPLLPPVAAPPPSTSAKPAPRPSASAPEAVPPPPAKPAARAPRAPAGEIGTAHAVIVERVARDGGWVAFCQARTDTNGDGNVAAELGPGGKLGGDTPQRYFARGAGAGETIDDLLAHDDSGRWVVIVRAGSVSLIDTDGGSETNLTALGLDARSDALTYRPHRAVTFDALGSRLVYLRGQGKDTRVVVRALSTGAETVLDPGAGDVWRIELDPTGRFVIAHALVDDTNRDKKLSWPAPLRSEARPCRGPVASYDTWVARGDEPVVRLLPVDGTKPETVPGFVTTLGAGVVVREPPGRLLLRKSGPAEELSGEKCGARVVLVDHEREQLLVACTKPKGRPKLELVSSGRTVALDADLAHQSRDQTDATPVRLFALYPGNDTKLLDLATRKLAPLTPGDVVLASFGTRSLIRRKRSLVIFDVESGTERALPGAVSPSLDLTAAPPLVMAAPFVVNLETEKGIGTVTGRPLALAADGKVLIARGGDGDGSGLAVGPLVWQAPVVP